MRYKNINDILPSELIEEIQKYIQGESIYIPKKDKQIHKAPTEYSIELEKRNARIYTKHLEGMSNEQLARIFSLAQSSIRRIIVEQRKKFEGMTEKIKILLSNWGLQNESVKQIYGTAWQVGEDYVLKSYIEKEALERNILINRHLDSMEVPVGGLYLTVKGEQYVEDEGQYFFISKKLKGSNIVNLKFGNKTATMMGEIIANLHIAFKGIENQMEIWDNSLLKEMQGWTIESFEKSGWQNISRNEYNDIVKNLEVLYDKLPVQLVHRDVHFGNFLFDNGEFSGYIDFDLSQKNIRIFDLCYFVLSVLSEREKFEITEEKWFEFVGNVFTGYSRIINLTKEEKQCAVLVMECIELLFLAYFEGLDDSALAKNAYIIFEFIKTNEKRITSILR